MKFEHTQVSGFEAAIRGMRNPKNSWHLSDSCFGIYLKDTEPHPIDIVALKYVINSYGEDVSDHLKTTSEEIINYHREKIQFLLNNAILRESKDKAMEEIAAIGPKDLKLMQNLVKAGPEHRKFMRQIFVSVDITAPLYWQISFCQ